MTREEEIKVSALKYLDHFTPDICGICNTDIYDAYMSGAKWADEHPNIESIWHDASEEPTEGLQTILVNCENSELKILKYRNGTPVQWSTFIIKNKITKWMYTHDILSKGGEK